MSLHMRSSRAKYLQTSTILFHSFPRIEPTCSKTSSFSLSDLSKHGQPSGCYRKLPRWVSRRTWIRDVASAPRTQKKAQARGHGSKNFLVSVSQFLRSFLFFLLWICVSSTPRSFISPFLRFLVSSSLHFFLPSLQGWPLFLKQQNMWYFPFDPLHYICHYCSSIGSILICFIDIDLFIFLFLIPIPELRARVKIHGGKKTPTVQHSQLIFWYVSCPTPWARNQHHRHSDSSPQQQDLRPDSVSRKDSAKCKHKEQTEQTLKHGQVKKWKEGR